MSTLIALAPTLIGVLAGIAIGLILTRSRSAPTGAGTTVAVLAGAIPAVVQGLVTGLAATGTGPMDGSVPATQRLLLTVPLGLGTLAVLALALPPPVRPEEPEEITLSSTDGAPRTVGGFLPRGWQIVLALLGGLEILVAVIAGRASELSESGHYLLYAITLGDTRAVTTIYGWYFSIPSLIILAVLMIVTVAALSHVVRRSAPGTNHVAGEARRARCRDIAEVATGGLLVHLGLVLHFLGETAALWLDASLGMNGPSAGTSLAALGPVLTIGGIAADVGGIALWTAVATRALVSLSRGTRNADRA